MANRYKIDSHPQKMQIERDIINGVPDTEIALNYVALDYSKITHLQSLSNRLKWVFLRIREV